MTPEDMQMLVPTYAVISRHSKDCPHFNEKHLDDCPRDCDRHGRDFIRCGCKKHISVYDPRIQDSKKRQSTIPAKTRSATDAEKIAQAYRDRHDPDKVARAKAEAALEAALSKDKAANATATIEEAVARFLIFQQDNPRRRTGGRSGDAADSTLKGYRDLLGNVVIEHGVPVVKRPGRLFTWLDTLPKRPVYVSDLAPTLVDDFRASWKAPIPGSIRSKAMGDQTTITAFTKLKRFLDYCKNRGKWIDQSPLDGIPYPTAEEGYRTAPFTAAQYESIIDTVRAQYTGDSAHDKQVERIYAFIELMRWGGLAIADATSFELSSMKDNGEISYRRVKTGAEAMPTIPLRVVTLLRSIEPIDADPNRPFYDRDILLSSNRNNWSRWMKDIFKKAGIDTVETAIRDRKPHSHMLRDTFAVNQLLIQKEELGIVDLGSIAKAIGDSEETLRKHYAPWVTELEDAQRNSQRKIVEAQTKKEAEREAAKQNNPKVVNIGGRK
jgi:integrase